MHLSKQTPTGGISAFLIGYFLNKQFHNPRVIFKFRGREVNFSVVLLEEVKLPLYLFSLINHVYTVHGRNSDSKYF